MAPKKIHREKLLVKKSADVHDISTVKKNFILLNGNKYIDAGFVSEIKEGEKIVDEINIFLRGKRCDRTEANIILMFLRSIPCGESVGYETLKKYKHILDVDNKKSLNTKSQYFSLVKKFTKHLISSGVIPHQVLPINFPTGNKKHKTNFIDAARYKLPSLLEGYVDEVRAATAAHGLREDEAQALVYGRKCMSSLRRHAENRINQHIKDWEFVDSIIESINDDEISYLKDICFKSIENKSLQCVVKILFARFGRAIPSSNEWPDGMSDWCRSTGGWKISRMSSAFFPSVKTLDAFLIIGLTDSYLMPDVDCVAFYAYLDCCKPSPDSRDTIVRLGKFRGAPLSAELSNHDSTVLAFQALSNRIKKLLPEMPGGKEILKADLVSMMVHCTSACGRPLRASLLDKSTLPHMVRRFIASAKKNDPLLAPLVRITGENFRSTHAYLGLLSGKSVETIRTNMHHSDYSTTEGYIQGIEAQSITNRRKMKYQEYLISEGKSAGERRTGSGYICGASENKKIQCFDYNGCSNCPNKRIVLESPELVAEWIAWESELSNCKDRLEYDNPDRWRNVWEPKLFEYQSLLEMTKSRTLKEAKKIAEGIVLPWIS